MGKSKRIKEILIATFNKDKAGEISAILKMKGLRFRYVWEFKKISPTIEDGATIEENAVKKARAAMAASGLPSLADDTGLEVDFLSGKPGVFSARFAGEKASYEDNNLKLLGLLKDVPNEKRNATFKCVMALSLRSGEIKLAVGMVRGRIAHCPAGSNGFGYDPLFIPFGMSKTFAQLSKDEKNSLSHRFIALKKMRRHLDVFAKE